MTGTDQDSWQRVKNRLRAELGEDVFSSWFARMEIEAVDNGAGRSIGFTLGAIGRIAAERTLSSKRVTAGASACQLLRTFSL